MGNVNPKEDKSAEVFEYELCETLQSLDGLCNCNWLEKKLEINRLKNQLPDWNLIYQLFHSAEFKYRRLTITNEVHFTTSKVFIKMSRLKNN